MIKELHSLRFIFIMLIFVHHLNIYPAGGSLGVAFFFVLSGFSLTLGYGKKVIASDFSYKNYVFRRLIKFYPIHWLCLFLTIPYVLIVSGKWNFNVFLANALLVQSWVPKSDYYFSFNSVSWFLADTVFLSLLFPFLCRFLLKLSRKGLCAFVVVFIILYIIAQTILYNHGVFAFIYINPISRIPDITFGIVLAIVYQSILCGRLYNVVKTYVEKNAMFITSVCLLSIGLLAFESMILTKKQTEIALFYWPLISVVIISASLLATYAGGVLKFRPLVYLGSVSFTFYMIHQIVIRYFRLFFENSIYENVILIGVLSIVVSLWLSYYFHKRIEIPMSNSLQRIVS